MPGRSSPSKVFLRKDVLKICSKFTGEYPCQGSSQNLKEVPQNFTEVFNVDHVTNNDVIQRNQHRKEKKINLSSIVINDVKLAS